MSERSPQPDSPAAQDPQQHPVLGYAAPSPLARHGDLFRDGPLLVARDGIMLIPFCLLCGQPSGDAPLRLKFTWDPSFKVTRQSTLQLRAAAAIQARLCPHHHRRWRAGRVLGLGGMIASALIMFASAVVAAVSESSDIPRYVPVAIAGMMIGFALFTGFLFLFTLKTRIVKCIRIDSGYVYLEGPAEAFLQKLPPLPL